MLLTYDNMLATVEPTLEEILKGQGMPDVIEVGETDMYWVYVNRVTKKMELMSKQTGNVIAKCSVSEAGRYGISPGQVKAAEGALAL